MNLPPLDRMYGLVLGYHGCDRDVAERILSGKAELRPKFEDYHWLGQGTYFWENDPERALDWAREWSSRTNSNIKKPAVLGAIIDLGTCLNLIRSEHLSLLKTAFEVLKSDLEAQGVPLPQNTGDLMKRRLDCAVIDFLNKQFENHNMPLDSARGVFFEDQPLYPKAGFRLGNHIQVCVRNPRCIKGFFRPRPNEMGSTGP